MLAVRFFDAVKKIDKLGVTFVGVLGSIAIAGAYAALHFGWFSSVWAMAGWLLVCLAFLAAGLGIQARTTPRNTNVHGAARPASESEAQASARGEPKSPSLRDQTFPD